MTRWMMCMSGVLLAQVAGSHVGAQSPCRAAGALSLVQGLNEGSGIAASRSRPGVLWAHNDSSAPVLVALDEQGKSVGQVRVAGVKVDDWEDIAAGPCPRGSCLYIGDIGDNNGTRARITIYRVPEPAAGASTTEPAEALHAKYPDGPHDAESLFVAPSGEIYLVTKGSPGDIAVYRLPRGAAAATVAQLERVGAPAAGSSSAKDRPTGAAMSPDGRWVAVRTSDYVAFFAATDFLAGRWKEAKRADLRELNEPRGEGITFGRDGSVFLLGEGTSRGGTFVKLECHL
jgi:hypothetical protein